MLTNPRSIYFFNVKSVQQHGLNFTSYLACRWTYTLILYYGGTAAWNASNNVKYFVDIHIDLQHKNHFILFIFFFLIMMLLLQNLVFHIYSLVLHVVQSLLFIAHIVEANLFLCSQWVMAVYPFDHYATSCLLSCVFLLHFPI